MAIKVYKYSPDNVPDNAEIVHFGYDPKEGLRVWAEVNSNDISEEKMRTEVVATGESIPLWGEHFGTAITPSGLVWHLYC